MLTTPGGTPASRINSPSLSEVSGASSAGFNTTVQPVASAGPTFQIVAPSGPFHGMIAPTTPIGSFTVISKTCCRRRARYGGSSTMPQGVREIFARQRILDGLAVDRNRHAGIPAQHAEHPLAGR